MFQRNNTLEKKYKYCDDDDLKKYAYRALSSQFENRQKRIFKVQPLINALKPRNITTTLKGSDSRNSVKHSSSRAVEYGLPLSLLQCSSLADGAPRKFYYHKF
jgi:hypothetical protein